MHHVNCKIEISCANGTNAVATAKLNSHSSINIFSQLKSVSFTFPVLPYQLHPDLKSWIP